jgi:predicted nucleic acid-binding protein
MAAGRRAVFLDTAGCMAILNASEPGHAEASRSFRELGARGVTIVLTDWIVAETGNGLARTAARGRFASAARLMLASRRVELVYVDSALMGRGLALYERRADKGWGLVDCVSFEVMRERGMTEAFTNDRHFGQAGFRSLLEVG